MRFIKWLVLPIAIIISVVLYKPFSALPLAVAPDSLSAKLLQPGFYQVGSHSVQLTDKTRLIATKKQGNISRKFIGKLWFPMIEEGLVAPGKHPLIIYQPGYGETYQHLKHTAGLLASKGYLVLSVNSPLPSKFRTPKHLLEDLANTPADVRFLLDKMYQWNNSPDTLFYSRIDPNRIGLIGHGIGGTGGLLTGFHPDFKDERISLLITVSSINTLFTDAFFTTNPDLPILNISSSNDTVINYAHNSLSLLSKHTNTWTINIDDGSHLGFSQYKQHTPNFFYNTLDCEVLNTLLTKNQATWKTLINNQEGTLIEPVINNECTVDAKREISTLLQFRITQLALLTFIEQHFADTVFEREAADNFFNQVFSLEHPNAHYLTPIN